MIVIGNSIEISGNLDPLLEARNLGRRRNGDGGWLLHNVRVVIRPGDRVAIVGPTGAGKTLLLRALALLDPLDEGLVIWNGQAVQGEAVPPYRSAVVYLHQRPTLFEGTVEANLRHPFSLRVHRNRRFDRDRIVGVLERLGRELSFLEKAHRDLSGGEGQIVTLLRALQLDPTILLLDEPTASLDGHAAQAIEHLIDGWFAERPGERALIWISHDREQARRVADRTFQMHSGRIVAEN
jgi:putative ABC transport system ATP-binding protein